jgi:hypothetical protein
MVAGEAWIGAEVNMVVNRSAPSAVVVPILVYEDVEKAIEWLCDTFGFTERLRAAGPGAIVTSPVSYRRQ